MVRRNDVLYFVPIIIIWIHRIPTTETNQQKKIYTRIESNRSIKIHIIFPWLILLSNPPENVFLENVNEIVLHSFGSFFKFCDIKLKWLDARKERVRVRKIRDLMNLWNTKRLMNWWPIADSQLLRVLHRAEVKCDCNAKKILQNAYLEKKTISLSICYFYIGARTFCTIFDLKSLTINE